ncbi:MAG TPA: hypothetical protein VJ856_03450 [Paludibacteraceae bacterium]|nr:hypothetical protein [Paludibacteraceae bacterium]
MAANLYIFNPEHDLALANYSDFYQAPLSARTFAEDLALLPIWFAEHPAEIFVNEKIDFELPSSFLRLIPNDITRVTKPSPSIHTVTPWGWNPAMRQQLSNLGVSEKLLPTKQQLEAIKKLSHRQLASEAMEFLKSNIHQTTFPDSAICLTSLNDIDSFSKQHDEIVLKAPISGSGKGLYWSKGVLTESLTGWCKRTLAKQGCVMGEKALHKIQDCAMEFYSDEHGQISFSGYSLFQTDEAGIYKNSFLLSDSEIEKALQEFISIDLIREVRTQLLLFFEQQITSNYRGYFGVDMFIFTDTEGIYRLNPAVEINMRMTMGMVARLVYDRFVEPGKKGVFSIQHALHFGELLLQDKLQSKQHPLIITNKKIQSGYLSLCPIDENTHYCASIIIQ